MSLKQLDTVIAFAVVMLLLSLLVTVFVQAVVSLLGLRGRSVQWTVETLMRELLPDVHEEDRRRLATEIISHPAIATTTNRVLQLVGSGTSPTNRRAPTAIRPEEIVLILERSREKEKGEVRTHLDKLFQETFPEDARSVGRTRKVEDQLRKWFGIVSDASSERFKLRTRWLTVGGATIMAFGFQVDSANLMRRLNEDTAARSQLVDHVLKADTLYKGIFDPAPAAVLASGGSTALSNRAASDSARAKLLEQARTRIDPILDEIYATELLPFRWTERDALFEGFGGKLATVLFLSLGAPFWYKLLNDLVGFRSVVAKKQESPPKEREGLDEQVGGKDAIAVAPSAIPTSQQLLEWLPDQPRVNL